MTIVLTAEELALLLEWAEEVLYLGGFGGADLRLLDKLRAAQ